MQCKREWSARAQLFPGLIYRMVKPKVVLLIFVSGKIVLTGAKVREDIYACVHSFTLLLLCARAQEQSTHACLGPLMPFTLS